MRKYSTDFMGYKIPNYTKKQFITLVKKEDTKNIYTDEELKKIYDNLLYIYNEVNESNFDINYMLKHKDCLYND